MVPFTLCAFTVGLDLVNQSLSTLTAAPMAMTAIQAGFMFVATMLWTIGCHVYMLIARFRGNEQVQPPPLVKSRSGERSPSRVPSELTLCLGMLSCQIVFFHSWWIFNTGPCRKGKLNWQILYHAEFTLLSAALRYPLSCATQTKLLFGWTPAALWFVAYQLINHEVSMYCSLSERTWLHFISMQIIQ